MPEKFSSIELPKGPVVVTRCVHFCAAHRLHNPQKDADWNETHFGKCNNQEWHGHNYELEVSVIGEPDPETGYIIDLKELKDILTDKILVPCDHKNLNTQVPFLADINPTAENLVKAFWSVIDEPVKNNHRRLFSIKLYETPRNIAEYRGPNGFD